jgi:hypothetical protein
MKPYFSFVVLLILLAGCNAKKQYMTSGPEVDLAKKLDAAYFARDWATWRSCYADTAKLNINQWTGHEIGVDQFVADLQKSAADWSDYKQGPTPYYEAVIDDDGKVYTHTWFEWIGTYKNGKEARTVVHITTQIVGGKIAWAGVIYDSHPLMAAAQADSTMALK